MSTFFRLLTSKTVLGIAITQLPGILTSLATKDYSKLAVNVGVILAGAGARDAVSKAANTIAKVNEGASS